MNRRYSLYLVAGAAAVYVLWQIIGHVFLMRLPMGVQHTVSVVIETTLAVLIAAVAAQVILHQQDELRELARLRDYLLRMEAHYLRLSPSDRVDPRQRLEMQALSMQFADLEQRFASPDAAARVRAAIGMAEIAQRRLADLTDPYPFFPRAASHLAAALYLERNATVRSEVLKALETVSTFAHQQDQKLVHRLIDDLVHANQMARDLFVDTLAKYCAGGHTVTDDFLMHLLPVTRLVERDDIGLEVLRDLSQCERCRSAARAQETLNESKGRPIASSAGLDRDLLQEIQAGATSLRDACSALALALRALSAPAKVPGNGPDGRFWMRDPGLDLSECFLAGADLREAQLQGANLSRCCLRGARLYLADLQWAKLWKADLREAELIGACLQSADLNGAMLQGAHLVGAELRNTCLLGAALANKDGSHRADFKDANWWDASFTDVFTGKKAEDIRGWLGSHFPEPEPTFEKGPKPGDKEKAVRAWLEAHSPQA